jgi:hypothetical protein
MFIIGSFHKILLFHSRKSFPQGSACFATIFSSVNIYPIIIFANGTTCIAKNFFPNNSADGAAYHPVHRTDEKQSFFYNSGIRKIQLDSRNYSSRNKVMVSVNAVIADLYWNTGTVVRDRQKSLAWVDGVTRNLAE